MKDSGQTPAHPLDKTDFESPSMRQLLQSGMPVEGPKRERKCTDVYCLLIFVFLNACLWTLSGWSYKEGNPQRLMHGWDVHGFFCGTGELADAKFTYFPIPLDSIDVSLCLPGCPVNNAEQSICPYDRNLMDVSGFGCYDSYPTKPFYNNYCLPADNVQRRKVLTWLYSEDQVMSRVVGDLARAWDELAIAGVVTFGAMMVYFIIFKCRYCTIPFYLLSMLVLLFLFAVLVYLLHEENWRVNGQICQPFGPVRMDECEEGDTAHGYRDLAWATASLGFCAGIAMVLMLPRLWKGHQILKNSSKALGFHVLPFVCPIVALVLGTSFYAYFITLLIFQVSTGDHYHSDNEFVPGGTVYQWEFDVAERVLVFFDVGMILWWFSFMAHSVEYVTAHTTAEWFFAQGSKKMVDNVRSAVHSLFRYHSGSVLLASILVPMGRLLRNLFGTLKFILRFCFQGCLGCSMLVCKPCLAAYEHWFKYMTSDGLAFQGVYGESFLKSAKMGYFLVKRNDPKTKSQVLLNSGNMVIWLFQLNIIMSGVVFCAWWLQYDDMTFKDLPSWQVTSVTAMAIYELFITWYFAQVYGCFVRGVMHGSIISFLVDQEANQGSKFRETPFGLYMAGNALKSQEQADELMSDKDAAKVAPAPIVSEGLHKDVGPSGPGLAGLIASEHPKTAPQEPHPPTTAPMHVPPTTAAPQQHPATGEEVESITGRKDPFHTQS